MLPFPRISQYGNTISNQWYNEPNVIMAYDAFNFISTGYGGAGFTDYRGKIIKVDAQNTASPVPAIASTGPINKFGSKGICTFGAGLVAPDAQVPTTLTNSSFTMDMWYRQETTTGTESGPFFFYTSMSSNSGKFGIWCYMDGNGPRYQNNGGNLNRPQSNYAAMISTSWVHIAYVYDAGPQMNYFFINGTLSDSFQYRINQPTGATFCGIIGHVNSPTGTNHSYVDRVRLSTGARWTSSFNPSTIYP